MCVRAWGGHTRLWHGCRGTCTRAALAVHSRGGKGAVHALVEVGLFRCAHRDGPNFKKAGVSMGCGLCFAAPSWPAIARGGGGPMPRLRGIGPGVVELTGPRRPRLAETEEMQAIRESRTRRCGDKACRAVRVGTRAGLLCAEFSASIIVLAARLLDAGSRLVAAQSFALASVRRAVKKMVLVLFVALVCIPGDARTYSWAGEHLSLASIENPMMMAAPHLLPLPLPVHLHGDAEHPPAGVVDGDAEHPRAGVLDEGQRQGAATAGVERFEESRASTEQQPQQPSPSSRAKANSDKYFSHFAQAGRERGEEGLAEAQQEAFEGCSHIMASTRSTHRSSSTLQANTGVPFDI